MLPIPEPEQQLGGKRVVADGPADHKTPIALAYQLPYFGRSPGYYLFQLTRWNISVPGKATGLLFHFLIPYFRSAHHYTRIFIHIQVPKQL